MAFAPLLCGAAARPTGALGVDGAVLIFRLRRWGRFLLCYTPASLVRGYVLLDLRHHARAGGLSAPWAALALFLFLPLSRSISRAVWVAAGLAQDQAAIIGAR